MAEHEPQSQIDFEHFNKDYTRSIRDIIQAVKNEASGANQERVADMFGSFFGKDSPTFLDPQDIAPQPEAVLKLAMSKLSDSNRLQLVVSNLLEGVKRGEQLGTLVERYEKLGLMIPSHRRPQPPQAVASEENAKDGSFLDKALGWARKLGSILCRIGWNAIRSIPHFVKLEPEVHLGFIGPVPHFSLSFKVKTDGVSLYELGETLFAGVGAV